MTDAEILEAWEEETPLRWRDHRVTIASVEMDGEAVGDRETSVITRILVRGAGLRGEVEVLGEELFPEQ